MLRDFFFLAISNLKHRGLRSFLTMLGIFIGIAAVVSLISLGQGLQSAITGQFATLSADTLTVTNAETGFGPPGSTAVRKLTSRDLNIIESVEGIEAVVPRLLRIGKVEYNKISQFLFIVSLPEDQEDIDFVYSTFSIETESGRLLKAEDRKKIIIGNDFKENNGFDKDIRVGSILKIQDSEFEVVGILEKASTFQVNSAIIMPEEDMNDIFNIQDEFDIIAVRVSDPEEIEIVASQIERKLRKDRNLDEGEEDFSVQTPIETISSIQTILNIVNIIVGGIAAISLLIGSIGIANTMYTSVLERTKEIGIMKAIGARNTDILLIFLIESGLLGLVGGIIGIIIGLVLAFSVASTANNAFGDVLISVSISLPLLIFSVIFSFILGISAGILPAYQASRLKPVEALRKWRIIFISL